MDRVSSAKDKVADFTKRWWALTTSSKRPKTDPSRLVTVDELPMYSEDYPKSFKFVEDPPLPLQGKISSVRKAACRYYNAFAERFEAVDRTAKNTANSACRLTRHLREEWTMVPKAIAITIGGLAGFVLGMKSSGFRRFTNSGVGMLTMAAFCYPHETVAIIRTGIAHAERTWHNFESPPIPPKPKKVDLSPPES